MMELQELIKNEIEFCNEIDCEKNEQNQFIYESKNGKSVGYEGTTDQREGAPS